MGKYSIEIPPVENLQQQREGVITEVKGWYIENSKRFLSRSLASYSEPEDTWMRDLLLNVESCRYWGTLRVIDGYTLPTKQEREETKSWAYINFQQKGIQKLLNIVVKTALLVPYDDGRPASKKGHTELYKAFVEQEDSIFHDAVTPEFLKRLNNGRFWENLPYVSPGSESSTIVKHILGKHLEDLDPSFASLGYEIFKRNNGERLMSSFEQFGKANINRFNAFIGAIEENKGINKLTPEQIFHLTQPYYRQIRHTVLSAKT